MKQKEIYQVLDEREHALKRSARYIGSIKNEAELMWVYDDDTKKFLYKNILVNKGLIKLFDEILSNSIDEHLRNSERLTEIKIYLDTINNTISVYDNGGIPVRKHSDVDMWIPELIFSQLRAGSNFDDTEQRTGAGTHGEGSVLVNIFSKEFKIETCDGVNKFEQIFSGNMGSKTEAKITKSKTNYTKITFKPDLEKFGLGSIVEVLDLLRMRVYEASACNSTIKFSLYINDVKDVVKCNNFKQFVGQFTDVFFEDIQDGWEVAIGSSDNGHQHISFVNSTRTYDGGTHVDMIMNKIISEIREYILKKHKVDLKPSDIRNHIFLFVSCKVYNPEWGTQTKEKMVSKRESFVSEYEPDKKLIKKILNSEIMESILDWIDKKKEADEKKQIREINKKTNERVEKLIDAKGKDRSKCNIFIFEGISAISAIRKLRDANTIGAYPLRGKFVNVHDITLQKLAKNQEAINLMNAIGLELGKEPHLVTLRYGKIYIATDMDYDGISISGLLINFFAKFWPRLFREGRIIRVLTPLYVAKNGKKKELLYSQKEYDDWCKTCKDINKWEVQQKKGLAALEDDEYGEMLKNPKSQVITLDGHYQETLEAWFGKDSELRKNKLK